MKRTLGIFALSLAFGVGGLYLVYGDTLLSVASYQPVKLTPALLIVCSASFLVFLVAPVLKLVLLCRYQRVRLSFFKGFLVHVLSVFGAAVTPSNSGGAPAIVGALGRLGVPVGRGVGVASQVFVLDLIFFAWSAPLALFYLLGTRALALSPSSVLLTAVAAGLAVTLAVMLTRYPKQVTRLLYALAALPLLRRFPALKGLAKDYYRSALSYRHFSPATLGLLHLLTALCWLSSFTLLWGLLELYGLERGWGVVAALLTNITVLGNFVPTPGASGFTEAVTGLLVGGTSGGEGSSAPVVLWRLATFYSFFIMGPLALRPLLERRPTLAKDSS